MQADIVSFIYLLATYAGVLILSSIGLMVIFGMMGVINMAHGALMMIGAYITAGLYYQGVPLPLGILAGGFGAAVVGVALERSIIRLFYDQLLSSLVLTWGLSLVITQGTLKLLGSSAKGVPTPLGSFGIGVVTYSYINIVVFIVAIVLVAGTWALFRFTHFGIRVRATMENVEIAEALGINVTWIYAATFGLGSFFAGIAGGLFALSAPITPFFGQGFTAMAFVTVVVGGAANVFWGIVLSPLFLSVINTLGTVFMSSYFGYIAMMIGALLLLVFLPSGISSWVERKMRRR